MYCQATKRTETEQLATLSRILGGHFGDPALKEVSFSGWEALFAYMSERAARDPFLLILDEFPYLASAAPALPSIIQALWKSRRAIYRIMDPYVAFWHDYMGPVFEEMCRTFVRRGARLPFTPIRVGSWWDGTSRNEIDVVALAATARCWWVKCKWGKINIHDLKKLQERANLLAWELSIAGPITYALFLDSRPSGAAVTAEVAAGRAMHFKLDDLFRGEAGTEV